MRQQKYLNYQKKGGKDMSKLGTLARFAVGVVVISTLWPIGLFGDE